MRLSSVTLIIGFVTALASMAEAADETVRCELDTTAVEAVLEQATAQLEQMRAGNPCQCQAARRAGEIDSVVLDPSICSFWMVCEEACAVFPHGNRRFLVSYRAHDLEEVVVTFPSGIELLHD